MDPQITRFDELYAAHTPLRSELGAWHYYCDGFRTAVKRADSPFPDVKDRSPYDDLPRAYWWQRGHDDAIERLRLRAALEETCQRS